MAKKKVDDTSDVLAAAIKKIEAEHGVGMILKNDDTPTNVKSISTGCYGLDDVFGCGGVPQGRIIEMYGAESSGKTTMALFIAGQLQKEGKKILLVDVEQAYDRAWAGKLGVDTDKLIATQPSTVEETMDILRAFIATKEIDLIIVDSVEAMIPKKELEEGALEKDSIGVKARLLNKYLRVITSEAAKTKTVIIFINQVRANVGVMYGPKDITPGGKALKYYASVRLAVSKGEPIKQGTMQIGNTVKVVAKKNKVGFPFREVELDLYYQSGIDLAKDTIDTGLKYGIITKAGNTYNYENTKLGVGQNQARDFFRENPEVYAVVRKTIAEKVKEGGIVQQSVSTEEVGDTEEGED